jgi:NAD(P)-dependent dehydrogenase (short-subunit alcohol dehydrogenase family)
MAKDMLLMVRTQPRFLARPQDGAAWVTGASAGLGRALALRLAAAGFTVAVTARRADALDSLAAEGQGRIVAYPGDVTDAPRMAAIVAAIEREQGPIALGILNAGVYHLAERERFDADLVWRTVETNLGGTVRCLDPLLAAMLPRRRGQIAIVASLAGYGGIPGSVAYGAAKAAMISMAEGLRLTHAPDGLTIQVVNPGFIATAMTAPNDYPMPFMMSAEAAAARVAEGLASGRFEITFPRRLAWPAKAAGLLPYAVWLKLMARATRRVRR